MEPIEPSLSAKFALVTQTAMIERCDDPVALRKLAIQLLQATVATKALLLHRMKQDLDLPATVPTRQDLINQGFNKALLLHRMEQDLDLPATVHPGKELPPPPPLPPELKPRPRRTVTPFTVEQRWYNCRDERGEHYRWGIRQDLINQGFNPDEVGHE